MFGLHDVATRMTICWLTLHTCQDNHMFGLHEVPIRTTICLAYMKWLSR